MNIEILYILFPALLLLHELEKVSTIKRWIKQNTDDVILRFSPATSLIKRLGKKSVFAYILIAIEELVIVSACTASFIYSVQWPLYALFWGYGIYFLSRILLAVLLLKFYVPGLVTAIFFIPYAVFGIMNLIIRFSAIDNLCWGVAGTAFVFLNLWVMHRIFK